MRHWMRPGRMQEAELGKRFSCGGIPDVLPRFSQKIITPPSAWLVQAQTRYRVRKSAPLRLAHSNYRCVLIVCGVPEESVGSCIVCGRTAQPGGSYLA